MGVIVGAVIALGTLIWAVARLLDGMSDAKFAARRFRWTSKARKGEDNAAIITDPREAAAVLLLQMARYSGPLDEREKGAVRDALVGDIASDAGEADDLIDFAGTVLKEVGDPSNTLRKYINPINDACSRNQKRDLISALERCAGVGGDVLETQAQFLQSIRRLLLNG